ncbi:MAG: hypothetical protein ACJAWL_003437 [Motiliproteus sp.]|jgi:hypothetical protein
MKIIRMLLPNNQVVDYSLEAMLYLQAEQGAAYSVVDQESGIVVEHAVLTRQADALLIEVEGEQVARVEQFYIEGMAATVDTGSPAQQLASNDAAAESADLVWEHAADAGAVADRGLFSAPLLLVGGIAAGGMYQAHHEDATPATPAGPVTVTYDLTAGTVETSDGSKGFAADVDYAITIIVDAAVPAAGKDGIEAMTGAANLGAGDTITIVGPNGTSSEILAYSTGAQAIARGNMSDPNADRYNGTSHGVADMQRVNLMASGSTVGYIYQDGGFGRTFYTTSTPQGGSPQQNKTFTAKYNHDSALWIGNADFSNNPSGVSTGAIEFIFS